MSSNSLISYPRIPINIVQCTMSSEMLVLNSSLGQVAQFGLSTDPKTTKLEIYSPVRAHNRRNK